LINFTPVVTKLALRFDFASANAVREVRITNIFLMTAQETEQPDIVDTHFRPFVRALGNLAITFALCESALLRLVTATVGGTELQAVAIKHQNAKDRVTTLAHRRQEGCERSLRGS
jgi:hypothetical protein